MIWTELRKSFERTEVFWKRILNGRITDTEAMGVKSSVYTRNRHKIVIRWFELARRCASVEKRGKIEWGEYSCLCCSCMSGCPSGWHKWSEHCFLVSPGSSAFDTAYAARERCLNKSADLPTLSDNSTNQFLANLIANEATQTVCLRNFPPFPLPNVFKSYELRVWVVSVFIGDNVIEWSDQYAHWQPCCALPINGEVVVLNLIAITHSVYET